MSKVDDNKWTKRLCLSLMGWDIIVARIFFLAIFIYLIYLINNLIKYLLFNCKKYNNKHIVKGKIKNEKEKNKINKKMKEKCKSKSIKIIFAVMKLFVFFVLEAIIYFIISMYVRSYQIVKESDDFDEIMDHCGYSMFHNFYSFFNTGMSMNTDDFL